jgi:peptidyl-prolyl cis-trans isomerase SurA
LQKLRQRGEQALKRAQAGEKLCRTDGCLFRCARCPARRRPRLASAGPPAQPLRRGGGACSRGKSATAAFVGRLPHRQTAQQARRQCAGLVQQTRARHILIRINEIVSEAEARRKLESVRERIANGVDFAEQARLYSQDGSAAKGGDLGWLNPGDTVPDFERAMDALKINEVSPVSSRRSACT